MLKVCFCTKIEYFFRVRPKLKLSNIAIFTLHFENGMWYQKFCENYKRNIMFLYRNLN